MNIQAISFTSKSIKIKNKDNFCSNKNLAKLIDRPAKLSYNRNNYSGKVKDKRVTSKIENMEDILERNPNSNIVKNVMQEYLKILEK